MGKKSTPTRYAYGGKIYLDKNGGKIIPDKVCLLGVKSNPNKNGGKIKPRQGMLVDLLGVKSNPDENGGKIKLRQGMLLLTYWG